MKILPQLIISLTVLLSVEAFAADMTTTTTTKNTATEKTMKPSAAYTAAMDDIKNTLGMVPTMFKMYPQEGLPAAWEEMKSVQMNPSTKITGKYKELIGLAVSSQIPCKYCVYFHKKFAALQGASEREMNEAIAIASSVRKWSTVAYGQNQDLENFKKDVDRMVKNVKTNMQKSTASPVASEAAGITTTEMAEKDIQGMYGFTPAFLSELYKPALPSAWTGLRDFHMSPNTALPLKVKGFIGLAIGSQMPCTYCVYIDSEVAKMDGATADELKEAIMVSATVRHWSTFLNGLSMDDNKFRREVDQMAANIKRKMDGVKTDRQASN